MTQSMPLLWTVLLGKQGVKAEQAMVELGPMDRSPRREQLGPQVRRPKASRLASVSDREQTPTASMETLIVYASGVAPAARYTHPCARQSTPALCCASAAAQFL